MQKGLYDRVHPLNVESFKYFVFGLQLKVKNLKDNQLEIVGKGGSLGLIPGCCFDLYFLSFLHSEEDDEQEGKSIWYYSTKVRK